MADVTQLFDAVPRPPGPFRLIAGDELESRWAAGHRTRRNLLFEHRDLVGYELTDVHPVPLGGDPRDEGNVRAVGVKRRAELAAFWNEICRRTGMPTDAPLAVPPLDSIPPDCAEHISPNTANVFYSVADRCHLIVWSEQLIGEVTKLLDPQGFLPFASDGAGLVFGVGLDGSVAQCLWLPMRQALTTPIGDGLSFIFTAASR